MIVQEIKVKDNKTRYILIDYDGTPIISANKFLKFKDNSGKARNTLRAYCFHLSKYFDFLSQKELKYSDIDGIGDIAEFMRWLQEPHRDLKISTIHTPSRKLKFSTINTYISTVMEFYNYYSRIDSKYIELYKNLVIDTSNWKRGYKDFLHHINKDKMFDGKYLKLREEKKNIIPLEKKQMMKLLDACTNQRDYLLLRLLWETGFRIGECMSLWLEDVVIDARIIDLKDRGELINNAEIKTITSPRRVNVTDDFINLYIDYIVDYHTDEIDTNFVFFKLSGPNKGQPMEYQDVDSLFKRLRKKTDLDVNPHLFRHTHFDALRQQEGWDWAKIQKRGGWANVQTPMQTYSHPSDKEIRESWELVEKNMSLKKENFEDEQ
ncbi:tyrosine-type recombinase/integrase [Acetobacterium carbinolicum]|uniref:tyrosine-type recombinase/integrase n=1 Tax=Acetobacterium carbinolicum TaxID=52690 RepID=UPI0039C96A64